MHKSIKFIIAGLLVWFAILAIYHTHKKMPLGLSYTGEEYEINSSDLEFLYDLTYTDNNDKRTNDQMIFDYIFEAIDNAEKYILVDMFLFNSYQAKTEKSFRNLSGELTEKLSKKKKDFPDIKIDFITDSINTAYGGSISPEIKKMEAAGINVVISDTKKLRDSNFIYSPIWRTFIQWFGNSTNGGPMKHPFSGTEKKITIRSYLNLINFKANHRKAFIADSDDGVISILSSANPHNGSSAHSNVAIAIKGAAWESIFETESAIAKISNAELTEINFEIKKNKIPDGTVQILSESKIKTAIIDSIDNAQADNRIMIAQFYIADRAIIKALLEASERGVTIDMILDPNKDAFGYEKNGIPNRQIAHELTKKSKNNINIRWYDTHGEQFHSKLFILTGSKKLTAILGSANLTRRNLDDYNLELNAKITVPSDSVLAKKMLSYFARIWSNENGKYTIDYESYEDKSVWKYIIYRIQESFGLSTF